MLCVNPRYRSNWLKDVFVHSDLVHLTMALASCDAEYASTQTSIRKTRWAREAVKASGTICQKHIPLARWNGDLALVLDTFTFQT